jgi:hypothetical protein
VGTLTLSDLKDEVRAGLGGRKDLDTRLTRFLNLAQQRLARLNDFDEMEQISVSVFPYTPAVTDKYLELPGVREVYSFKHIEGTFSHKLTQLTQRMWNRVIPAPQEYMRDRPRQYCIWANTLILYPLANKANMPCELWWTKWPTDFNDSVLTAVSEYIHKDEILVELALVYAYNSLAKIEDADFHWNRVRPLLLEAVQTDMERPDIEVRPGPSLEQLSNQLPTEYWNDPFIRSGSAQYEP